MNASETSPEFTLPGTDGETIRSYSLEELTEGVGAILIFYPFNFSPVCTDQLCTFRDAEWLTFTDGLEVVGISVDSVYSHKQFINEYDLQFPLLTDRLGEVAESYGFLKEEFEDHPRVPRRSIVAVDDSRRIRYTWVPDSQYEAPQVDELEDSISWFRNPQKGDDSYA